MDIALVCSRLVDAAAATTPPLNPLAYAPDNPPAPCVYVSDVSVEFDRTFGRSAKAAVTLTVLLSRSDDRASQGRLMAHLSDSGAASVRAALDAARGEPGESALAGACDDFHVTRVAGFRFYESGAVKYVGAEFTVDVYGPGG